MVPNGKPIGQIKSPDDKTVNTNYHSLNAHLLTTPQKFADDVLEID
jgi:hypothetical protein